MSASTTSSFDRLEEYFQQLHRFGVRLSEQALRFQQQVRQGRFSERGGSFSYDPADPGHIINRSVDITRNFEFIVAFTGAFSSGKSTLLNVLLDTPDLLPASAIPLTAVCTVIRHGEEPRVQVRYVSLEESLDRIRSYIGQPFRKPLTASGIEEALARPENFLEREEDQAALRRFAQLLGRYERIAGHAVAFEERQPFIAGGGITRSGGTLRYHLPTPGQEQEYLAAGGDPELWVTREWLALIRDVTLWVDSPLLHRNVVFLDLPGLNCREDYHRRAIREYCNLADCIVVVTFQPGNQADEDVIESFRRLSANYRKKLFFVLNRVDQFQTEPVELSRSFDYLTRDCIGRDFPRSRCFLTSAYLAREKALASPRFAGDFQRFAAAFSGFQSAVPGIAELVSRVIDDDDPGGVRSFRDHLQAFLTHDAYRTKISEVLDNYDRAIEELRGAASPLYDEVLRMDQRELQLQSALSYFDAIEEMAGQVLYSFRQEYLRGNGNGAPGLSDDVDRVLETLHQQIQSRIVKIFNQPLPTPAPRQEPVGGFDLRRIADDASIQLRREFQDIIVSAVIDCVRRRLHDHINRVGFRDHVGNLFRGSPKWPERLDQMLDRFEFMLRHSLLCKIRVQFYRMPGGRDLRRLDRHISSLEVKDVLIQVFSEFYPDWIYQHIYGAIQDELWLYFYLDTEEFEAELQQFFESSRAAVTTAEVLDEMSIPEEFGNGIGNLREVSAVCREIERLIAERDALRPRVLELA